jgi:SAM-dependent methyltransferase
MTEAVALRRQQGNTDAWERAYLRFETPAEERRKFIRRLRRAGADEWSREALVLDLFSGRGGGSDALREMGFSRVTGLDLSARLLLEQRGSADRAVADCRQLPIGSRSVDIAIVQGGLHHLPRLGEDLPSTLREIARVLRSGGLFVAVEPWRTPFLDLVHWLCDRRLARAASSKIDALATMIEHERTTYEAWLGNAGEVLRMFDRVFTRRQMRVGVGKLLYVGAPR